MHGNDLLITRSLVKKHALVTGVGNCVGKAAARLLAAAGAQVLAADSDEALAKQVAAELHADGATVSPVALDPCKEMDWQRVMSAFTNQTPLHLLVNAAQRFSTAPVESIDGLAFHRHLQSNAVSTWLGQKHAISSLRTTGGGVIINITSVLARVGAANCAAYCAAARGVLMTTKSAALECARDKLDIIVSAVMAGRIEGDPAHFPDGRVLPHAPAVAAEDVAAAVLFLACEGASYMTGVELPVDGGWLSQ